MPGQGARKQVGGAEVTLARVAEFAANGAAGHRGAARVACCCRGSRSNSCRPFTGSYAILDMTVRGPRTHREPPRVQHLAT
jgi:hypothetical protein